jgi:hypothetical protein
MARLTRFFAAWDALEAMHPFGVASFARMFIGHGVPSILAFDVDEYLFLDLMTPRQMAIRRIKVEARISQCVFWVYVDLNTRVVSFQSNPQAPLTWSVSIDGDEPSELVRLIIWHHRTLERGRGASGRCIHSAMRARLGKHLAKSRSD